MPDGIPAIVPQDLFDQVQEKLAKPKVSAEFMTFWLHRFRKLDARQKAHRKMLIDTFVNAIFLFDDLKAALDTENTGSDLDCSTAPA